MKSEVPSVKGDKISNSDYLPQLRRIMIFIVVLYIIITIIIITIIIVIVKNYDYCHYSNICALQTNVLSNG